MPDQVYFQFSAQNVDMSIASEIAQRSIAVTVAKSLILHLIRGMFHIHVDKNVEGS
jgi:hypothetical protein